MHGKPDGTGPSERRSRPRLREGARRFAVGRIALKGRTAPKARVSRRPNAAGVQCQRASPVYTILIEKKSTDYQN